MRELTFLFVKKVNSVQLSFGVPQSTHDWHLACLLSRRSGGAQTLAFLIFFPLLNFFPPPDLKLQSYAKVKYPHNKHPHNC